MVRYLESYDRSEQKGLICIPSGNHDMDRLARHVYGDNRKLAFAFLLTMPGAPFIYYGDEIGMRYVEDIPSVEGGYGRTGSRSPMQWNTGVNAGFSSGAAEKLYIPIDPASDRPTVEEQMKDENSLWHEIQRLIEVRQTCKALQSNGKITFLCDGGEGKPLAYVREAEDERILVVINPRETAYDISMRDLRISTQKGLAESNPGDRYCESDVTKIGECLYYFGNEPLCDAGVIKIAPKSAAFMKLLSIQVK